MDVPFTRAYNPSNNAILTLGNLPLVVRNPYVFWFTLQQFTAGAWTKWTVPAGLARRLVVRAPNDATGAVLAFADDAAFNQETDWDDVSPADGFECAAISLNTPELLAWQNACLLAGRTPRLVLEFSAINPTDPSADPLTVLEAEFLLLDSWNVTSQPPSPGQPAYMTAADLQAALARMLNLPDGWRITANAATGQVYLEEIP